MIAEVLEKTIVEVKNVSIKYDSLNNTLLELTNMTTDLNHLIIFGEMLADEVNPEIIKAYFYPPKKFMLDRDNQRVKKYSEKIVIKDIKKGSIEIVIGSISIISAVVLSLLSPYMADRYNRANEKIEFNVSVEDKELNKLLDEYSERYYGDGDEGFENLQELLIMKGYSIKIMGKNQYLIEHVINEYVQKIVRTIKKN